MSAKKRGQPAPRWREFLLAAAKRVPGKTGVILHGKGGAPIDDYATLVAGEIVESGQGAAFLKSVRRGRSTQKQNLRYQLLREVERLMGDAVPRRRPDANTPDSVALKKTVRLELEAYVDAGKTS